MMSESNPPFEREKVFKQSLRRTLAVPILILAVSPLILLFMIERLLDVIGWDRHTIEVFAQFRSVEKLYVDMETAVRGYQLTRDPSFITPYDQASRALSGNLDRLAELVRDNPTQSQNVVSLRHAGETWRHLRRR